MRYEFDGYQTNLFDGTRVNGSEEWAARASALIRIGESSNLTVTAQHNSYDGLSYRLSNVANGDGRFPDHIVNNVPEDPHETSRSDGINVRVESSLRASLELTSITDYRENSYTFGQNLDATPDLSINFFQTDVGVSSLSQELRLGGATSSITWFAGVSYWREHAFARNTSLVLNGFTATALGLVAPGTLPDDALLEDVFGGDGVSRAYAAYADGAWHLAPRWNLRFGTRFTRDEKDWISLTKQMDMQLIGPAIPDGRLRSTRTWSNVSPRLVLDYSPNTDQLLYASVTRGYKAGGFNSLTDGVSVLDFGPEHVTAYELGIKSTLAGSRLQIDASAYYNDYRDLQVLTATNNTVAVSNAAQARVVGLELEGTWQTPLPGLQVFGNISYQDAVYLEGTLANIGDVAGKRLPVTPRFKLSLSSSYARKLRRGELELSASFNGQDKSFDATNREDLAQPAYGVLNARIHYEAPSSRWGIALIGDNLLNKGYAILAQDPFALGASYIKARPRMYRAQVTARF
jgi:iron complex outermembrane receptor protein